MEIQVVDLFFAEDEVIPIITHKLAAENKKCELTINFNKTEHC